MRRVGGAVASAGADEQDATPGATRARDGATQRFPFTRAAVADPMPAEALEPYKGKCIVMWTSYVSNQLLR